MLTIGQFPRVCSVTVKTLRHYERLAAKATRVLPAAEVAVSMHVGPFDQLEGVYQAMFGWINSNGFRVTGPPREISHNDPAKYLPEQYVTEVQIPVSK